MAGSLVFTQWCVSPRGILAGLWGTIEFVVLRARPPYGEPDVGIARQGVRPAFYLAKRPLLGTSTLYSPECVEWGFCEVRLPPGARERENPDSFRADDPLFPNIRERVRL
jgi:hypothetical protein